jgi:hypothetical protein
MIGCPHLSVMDNNEVSVDIILFTRQDVIDLLKNDGLVT